MMLKLIADVQHDLARTKAELVRMERKTLLETQLAEAIRDWIAKGERLMADLQRHL